MTLERRKETAIATQRRPLRERAYTVTVTYGGRAVAVSRRRAWTAWRVLRQLPGVAVRLIGYSPRGFARLVRLWVLYLRDDDTALLRAHHAAVKESADYVRVSSARASNLRARLLTSGLVALGLVLLVLAWVAPDVLGIVVGAVVLAITVRLLPKRDVGELASAGALAVVAYIGTPYAAAYLPRPPVWAWWLLAALVVAYCGWAGRPMERALVAAAAIEQAGAIPPLRAPMVTAALCTLGVAKMKDPDEIRLLMDVARVGAGYQVDLELPPGVIASEVQEKREELAGSMRRELGCVWPSVGKRHPGHLSLYVSDQSMATGKQVRWPLLDAPVVDLFAPIEMFTNNLGAWVKAVFAYTAWVCGAVPRMGKTYAARQFGLVAGLDLRSKVLAFDLKGTGDLSSLAHFAHAYSVGDEPEDIEIQLEWVRWVRAEMRRRAKLVRDLTLEENPEKGKVTSALASIDPDKFGPVVLVVDECQVWFTHAVKEVQEEFKAICTDLVKRGPALGIIPFFATQKPDAKSIPTDISDNAVARLCFKVNGQVSNDQVLGTSSYRQGIRATQFSFADKGVAYFVGEGADALIVRTVYGLDASTADDLGQKVRAMRIAKGRLTGDAAGDVQEPAAPVVDLLDDVREVITTEGRRALGLTAICSRLALLRPATYGTWDNDTLGSALRGREIEPKSVHCPVEKRSVKGVKLDWLEDLT